MESIVTVADSTSFDLQQLASCYRRAFPNSLSSAFGPGYVMKMLSWFLDVPGNFLFHIEDRSEGRIIGFCGGLINDGVRKRGSASEMIQFAFWEGVRALLIRPWLIFHKEMRSKYGLVFRNVRRRFIRTKRSETYIPGRIEAYVGLVVIGVDKGFQNRGLSRFLMEAFEKRAFELGYRLLKLSVKRDNQQAIRAYQKAGWSIKEEKGDSTSMIKRLG